MSRATVAPYRTLFVIGALVLLALALRDPFSVIVAVTLWGGAVGLLLPLYALEYLRRRRAHAPTVTVFAAD